jgi:RNA polymerase primary sigma factor
VKGGHLKFGIVGDKKMNINKVRNRSKRALQIYLKEISKIPLLTLEQEKELGRRARAGDKDAQQRLVESNLRFVILIAKKFTSPALPLLDLINEGNIGLLKAAARFDPERQIRFASYAVWWIRQSILFYLSQSRHSFRLPPQLFNLIYRITKIRSKIRSEQTEMPDRQTLAQLAGASLRTLNSALNAADEILPLDHPVDGDGGQILGDTLEQTTFNSAESETINSRMKDDVKTALSILTDVERKVLQLRFGLQDGDPRTLNAVGMQLNRSRERIRQIELTALTKLRKSLSRRVLKQSSASYNNTRKKIDARRTGCCRT